MKPYSPLEPPGPGAPPAGPREPLARALARAASELQAHQPPAALREAVLCRLAPVPAAAASSARADSRPRLRAWACSGGLAALAMLLVASTVLLLPPSAGPATAGGGEFVPLVGREDWPDEASAAWLVRSELPQERLAALGLPYDPARAAEPVRAELLVHPSGLVLALRLID
jgi:hypothetical protein